MNVSSVGVGPGGLPDLRLPLSNVLTAELHSRIGGALSSTELPKRADLTIVFRKWEAAV
jgi:hypothetical protein